MSARTLLSLSDGADESVDLTTWRPREIRDGELLWIDVQAPTDDERNLVASALSLEAGTLDALADGDDTPDAHVLDDEMLVTVQIPLEDVTQPPYVLRILIGQRWAVTWHPDPVAFLDEHRERIQDQREVGRLTPLLLLVAMLDWHLDTFYDAAEQLEHDVDELDDVALRGDDEDVLARLVEMRRRIARVRRLLSLHRDMYSGISHAAAGGGSGKRDGHELPNRPLRGPKNVLGRHCLDGAVRTHDTHRRPAARLALAFDVVAMAPPWAKCNGALGRIRT